MDEHPILFNSEMILAERDGRKTCTRRNSKLHAINEIPNAIEFASQDLTDLRKWHFWVHERDNGRHGDPPDVETVKCPYGVAGDILWIRENHAIDDGKIIYQADFEVRRLQGERPYGRAFHLQDYKPERWRPSIHMPRWASRRSLLVKSIKVERLHDISDDDVKAEGVPHCESNGCYLTTKGDYAKSPQSAFKSLWESIHGEGAWKLNPWLWVVHFERIERSTDWK